jgi:EmrB/QacA subfamily drug resistance transporter
VTPTRPDTFDDLKRRRWELLALTSVGAFMGPLDGAIVSVALPVMSPELGLSFSASMWVQAVYLLVSAVLLIPLGRLADARGRMRFYLVGIVVFAAGSLLCAASMSGAWLIASRALQGAGAALLGATAVAIVTAAFPPQERGRALGISVAAVYLGLSVGPPLGGFLTDAFGWEAIFLVNVPIAAVVLIWGWRLLPRDERAGATPAGAVPAASGAPPPAPRPDLAGSALWGAFLICLLVPLTFAPQWGWAASRSLGLLALAALSLVAFVVVERHVADPLLDLDLLLHNRLFAASSSAALLNYMALYAVSVLTAVFLEVVQGRSAALTGWIMLSQPLMQAVLAPLAGRLSDRTGSRVLATAGMVLTAAGMALLGSMPQDASLPRVMLSLAVVGVGMALFSAPNTSAVMGSVPRHQLGLAGAFIGTMRTTGMALSVAILGGIAASQLGRVGGRLIFGHGQGLGDLGAQAVTDFASGYSYAMYTGAALAVFGALISLTRGSHVGAAAGPVASAGPGAPAHPGPAEA